MYSYCDEGGFYGVEDWGARVFSESALVNEGRGRTRGVVERYWRGFASGERACEFVEL